MSISFNNYNVKLKYCINLDYIMATLLLEMGPTQAEEAVTALLCCPFV